MDSRTEDVAVEDSEDDEQTEVLEGARTEVGVDYEGRGETVGPWDVDDANAPDYDEYLSLGAYYLPFVQGIQLRIKANNATHEIVGATMTIGNSSLEVEAFAAPKTRGQDGPHSHRRCGRPTVDAEGYLLRQGRLRPRRHRDEDPQRCLRTDCGGARR